MVESPLSQPIVNRNKKMYTRLNVDNSENYIGNEGLIHIKSAEGQLIEAFQLVKKRLPKWNKIGGVKDSIKL